MQDLFFNSKKGDSLRGCASLAGELKMDTSVRLQRFVLLPCSSSADEGDQQNRFGCVFVLFACVLFRVPTGRLWVGLPGVKLGMLV